MNFKTKLGFKSKPKLSPWDSPTEEFLTILRKLKVTHLIKKQYRNPVNGRGFYIMGWPTKVYAWQNKWDKIARDNQETEITKLQAAYIAITTFLKRI